MIDQSKNLIIINNQIKTAEIDFCSLKPETNCYTIKFRNSDKFFTYRCANITWLRNPTPLDYWNYKITYKKTGNLFINIAKVLVFNGNNHSYYHIQFTNGKYLTINDEDLILIESCFSNPKAKDVFDYLKSVAQVNSLKAHDGYSLLSKQYEHIDFIDNTLSIAPYLTPSTYKSTTHKLNNLIFPFGCNSSQIKAVQEAFSNQLSVIQGPPGTGKTQTILNILSNIIIQNKTAIVVSNNNSATDNILEKLTNHNLNFLVASLGRNENKQQFLSLQSNGRHYPNELYDWKDEYALSDNYKKEVSSLLNDIKKTLAQQERLACRKQQLSALELEWKHFQNSIDLDCFCTTTTKRHPSKIVLQLLNEVQDLIAKPRLSWFNRIKWSIKKLNYHYFFRIKPIYTDITNPNIIKNIQTLFYLCNIDELTNEIKDLESSLSNINAEELKNALSQKSMRILKSTLFSKYGSRYNTIPITEQTLQNNQTYILDEFPIILSTTFSARNSLPKTIYDYIIMDEASQVAVETGALSLTCAKNAIIVGDTMQLPNIVSNEEKILMNNILTQYNINSCYDCSTHSFLQSIIDTIPSVPQTLLREHYRCAPDIINFCNQKFYRGELIIMTDKDSSEKSIYAIKTPKGNHNRNNINQREIDVIKHEILPTLHESPNNIGIIAPYNTQVNAITYNLNNGIDTATVHKFQGREKDIIIMSVTDDIITPFADDANLLNVAVSRAKKMFYLIVSGNEQNKNSNINDLLHYIEYSQGTVTDSSIHSIFDLLYEQHATARAEYLKLKKRISIYDSENLTHALITDLLKECLYFQHLNIVCHYPLNLIIKDFRLLTEKECKYASNNATHVDFLIYNRASKRPVLSIEVDGWSFHKEGSQQAMRDNMKNAILQKYNIPLLRLSTTGSNEKDTIYNTLMTILYPDIPHQPTP